MRALARIALHRDDLVPDEGDVIRDEVVQLGEDRIQHRPKLLDRPSRPGVPISLINRIAPAAFYKFIQ